MFFFYTLTILVAKPIKKIQGFDPRGLAKCGATGGENLEQNANILWPADVKTCEFCLAVTRLI
jgi:hypothetical protein